MNNRRRKGFQCDYIVVEGILFYPLYDEKQWFVSACGKVVGPKGIVLKPKSQGEYLIVSYQADTPFGAKIRHKYVHRLVARVFHERTEYCGTEVNHIDGNKLNNHYTNLEWVTRKQNVQHAIANGLTTNIPTKGQVGFQCKS